MPRGGCGRCRRCRARDGNRRSGANARAIAAGSPGILSGNVIQVPINVPINVCGNGLNAIGLLNPTAGNVCING